MKTVSVTEFRSNLKKYLEVAEKERLVIYRSKGSSFVIVPLEEEKEEYLLNDKQKKAINQALESVANGKVYSHEEAMNLLKSKHPKYFK